MPEEARWGSVLHYARFLPGGLPGADLEVS